jgi:hypothetical protein
VFRAQLPAAREALAAWGVDDWSGNADMLATELVADGAGHAGSSPGSSAKSPNTLDLPGRGLPTPTPGGRGMAIVTALATASCVRAKPGGKTAWFTRRPTAWAVLPAVTTGAGPAVTPPLHPPGQLDGQRRPSSGREWDAHPAKGPRRP